MAGDPIVIAFCVSDSFIRHAGVVIASILASNPGESFAFHVLCGDLSQDNRGRLLAMAGASAAIVLHDVASDEATHCPVLMEHLSREAYFRYLIPELVAAPRVIYSDVDVLVRGPLRPLWEADLRGCPLGAVREACDMGERRPASWEQYRHVIGMREGNAYFYSGLLLMDCERLRAEQAAKRLFEETRLCAKTLQSDYFRASDQVVINRVFQGRIQPLPERYCMTGMMLRLRPGEPVVIRHYMGHYEKPWCNVAWNWGWLPYLRMLLRTPWRGEAARFVLGHLRGVVWSVQTKKNFRRGFLFGVRVFKRFVPVRGRGRRVFVTFADARLDKTLRRIRREARRMGCFDEIHALTERDLEATFRGRFADKLRPEVRGFGYWVWKPEVILRQLERLREGEGLLYVDAGCHLNPKGLGRLEDYFAMAARAPTGIVATRLDDYVDRNWTKGDLIDRLGVRDRADLLDSPTIQSGTLFIRKCPEAERFLRRWAGLWDEDFALMDDTPSRSPNAPAFREHRHDQSAFSLLAKLDGGIRTFPASECFPKAKLPSGSPDWSAMDPRMPIWHCRDKAFHYPLRWHLLRLASRLAPSRSCRLRLRERYRAIPPQSASREEP